MSSEASVQPLKDANAVTGLGATCRLASLSDQGRTAHFDVGEFIEFDDRTRLVLHDGVYGFSESARESDQTVGSAKLTFARDDLACTAQVVVGPEEANEHSDATAQEQARWQWLSDRAREGGVVISAEQLESLPYRVEFDESTERLLAAE